MQIGLSWSGKVLVVDESVANLNDFREAVAKEISLSAEDLLFITPDGAELTEDNFLVQFKNNQMIYAFHAVFMVNREPEINSPIQGIEPLSHVGPRIGTANSGSLSIDGQIENLKGKLLEIQDSLKIYSDRSKVLVQYSHDINERIQVLEGSLRVATLNLRLYQSQVIGDLDRSLRESKELTEKINLLLNRCPMDFALLKIIPVAELIKKEIGNKSEFLIDLGPSSWQDDYLTCCEERDNLLALQNDLIKYSNYPSMVINNGTDNNAPNSNELSLSNVILSDLSLLSQNLEADLSSIGKITSVDIENHDDYFHVSENVKIVQKSSRLLSLAELASKFNVSYLNSIENLLENSRIKVLDAGESLKLTNLNFQKKLAAIIQKQHDIMTVIDKLQELPKLYQKVSIYLPILDTIHAFPVAYIAVLCELCRRNLFLNKVKENFSLVENQLDSILIQERTRREHFDEELYRLVDAPIMDKIIHGPELTGNVVLFLSDEFSFDFNSEIKRIEKVLINGQQNLAFENPIKIQIQKFLETIQQMRKRILSNNATFSIELSSANNRSFSFPSKMGGTPDKTNADPSQMKNLISAYEDRIRNLERLLQENYAAAKLVNKNSGPTDLEELKQSITEINDEILQRDSLISDYKSALHTIAITCNIDDDQIEPFEIAENCRLRFDELKRDSIAISNFKPDDRVLCLPTVRNGVWSIFNVGNPNCYIHPESLKKYLNESDHNETRDWILAEIKLIKVCISQGKKENPYRLPKDYVYNEVYLK